MEANAECRQKRYNAESGGNQQRINEYLFCGEKNRNNEREHRISGKKKEPQSVCSMCSYVVCRVSWLAV
jgi:hypothetical protein